MASSVVDAACATTARRPDLRITPSSSRRSCQHTLIHVELLHVLAVRCQVPPPAAAMAANLARSCALPSSPVTAWTRYPPRGACRSSSAHSKERSRRKTQDKAEEPWPGHRGHRRATRDCWFEH
ncbi:hypothetical protein SETIT_1G035800v2 [Setaria italica]|uniref:Uncharacterized protein n=1 Tax=Setaria italica TaxID=4555 RepID=K3YWR5_SETIT|nr:hypothetical protein SETIT_1G035800v2 [Setaria italica]